MKSRQSSGQGSVLVVAIAILMGGMMFFWDQLATVGHLIVRPLVGAHEAWVRGFSSLYTLSAGSGSSQHSQLMTPTTVAGITAAVGFGCGCFMLACVLWQIIKSRPADRGLLVSSAICIASAVIAFNYL